MRTLQYLLGALFTPAHRLRLPPIARSPSAAMSAITPAR